MWDLFWRVAFLEFCPSHSVSVAGSQTESYSRTSDSDKNDPTGSAFVQALLRTFK